MHTPDTVSALIRERIESDRPDEILQLLRRFDGKPITTRILKALPESEGWRLIRHYGWTDLQNAAYWHSSGSATNGITLMLARSEGSVALDLAWMEANNQSFFEARRERNAKRREALENSDALADIAQIMNNVQRLRGELDEARKDLDVMTEYGSVFYPDNHVLQEACNYNYPKR